MFNIFKKLFGDFEYVGTCYILKSNLLTSITVYEFWYCKKYNIHKLKKITTYDTLGYYTAMDMVTRLDITPYIKMLDKVYKKGQKP